MTTNTIFVYGTLKRGCFNDYMLKDSEFIDEVITKDPYLLIHDSLPFLIKNSDHEYSTKIKGELYEVTDDVFKKIDKLEGHPTFYTRQCIWVINKGNMVYAWCYFINDHFVNDIKEYSIIKNGRWEDKWFFH